MALAVTLAGQSRIQEPGSVIFNRRWGISATGSLSIAFGHSLKPIKGWNFGFDLKELNVLRKVALVRD